MRACGWTAAWRGNITRPGRRSCARFRVGTRFLHAFDNPQHRPRAAITAVATYVPDRVVTNAELATRLDTSDDWIATPHRHPGAPHRRARRDHLHDGRGGGPPAHGRARARARATSGRSIVATVTPDMMFPATACLIQDQVGLREHLGV